MLFGFVRESLVDGWQPFELIAPGGQKLQESEDVALAESNLVGWIDPFVLVETKQSIFNRDNVSGRRSIIQYVLKYYHQEF